MPEYFRSSYFSRVYEDLDGIIADARKHLARKRFDTLVGTGLSGSLVIPRIADALECHWLIVRKPNDGSHSYYTVEGALGNRWIFVDDFISSGTTFRRCFEAVATAALERRVKCKLAGAWTYEEWNEKGAGFTTAKKLVHYL